MDRFRVAHLLLVDELVEEVPPLRTCFGPSLDFARVDQGARDTERCFVDQGRR